MDSALCTEALARGENASFEVRTVASISTSIPPDRCDCDTTWLLLGVVRLLGALISVVLVGEVLIGDVELLMLINTCYYRVVFFATI